MRDFVNLINTSFVSTRKKIVRVIFISVKITFIIIFSGGSSSEGENGGPGISFFQGLQITNLRVDNGCQQPRV